ERDWLAAQLRSAAQPHPSAAPSLWRAFRDRNALLLALALSAANVGNYAIVVYMPTLLKQASTLSVEAVTALTALPFCAGMAGVVLAGRSSDHSGERRLHTAIALFAAGLLFAASVIPGLPFAGTLLALCLMAGCAYAWPPPYWVLPGMVLPPEMAAASIGFINALGNLGGFFGPTIVGAVVGRGYSMGVAVLVLAASYFVAALAVLAVRKRAPAPQVNR
ncbi:MAG: MFS transporter, partial [Acidobacteria bacterium]|nr:MFS transporter [Acidobacteriota bacterium]